MFKFFMVFNTSKACYNLLKVHEESPVDSVAKQTVRSASVPARHY